MGQWRRLRLTVREVREDGSLGMGVLVMDSDEVLIATQRLGNPAAWAVTLNGHPIQLCVGAISILRQMRDNGWGDWVERAWRELYEGVEGRGPDISFFPLDTDRLFDPPSEGGA